MKLVIYCAAILIVLASCSIIPKAPTAKTNYLLIGKERSCISTPDAGKELKSLVLRDVIAPQYLSGQKIAYRKSSSTVSYYQLATWAEPLSTRSTTLAREALECSGLFKGVSVRSPSTFTDWALQLELLDFYHDLTTEPSHVTIALRAELVDLSNRNIIGTVTLRETKQLNSISPDMVVAQLNQGLNSVLDQLVEWIRTQGS